MIVSGSDGGDWLGAILQGTGLLIAILTAIGGWLLASRQLHRQHLDAIDQQRELLKDQIRLEQYRSMRPGIERLYTDISVLSSSVNMLADSVERYWQSRLAFPRIWPSVSETTDSLLRKFEIVSQATIDVQFNLRSLVVGVPAFDTFSRMIGRQATIVRSAWNEFFQAALPLLPNARPPHARRDDLPDYVETQMPTADLLSQLRERATPLSNELFELITYLGDIQTECQNHLLGGLFGQSLPRRKPLDPNKYVLSSDHDVMDRLKDLLDREYREFLAKYAPKSPPNAPDPT